MRVKGFCAPAGKPTAASHFVGLHGASEKDEKDQGWTVLTQHVP